MDNVEIESVVGLGTKITMSKKIKKEDEEEKNVEEMDLLQKIN